MTENEKPRVTGIGGIFLKSKHPDQSKAWYEKHLGIDSGKWGCTFEWRKADRRDQKGYTAWNIFDYDTEYTQPSKKDCMINYRVQDLETLIKTLKDEGVEVIGDIQEFEYGKFAWILDPDGYKVELWEPNDGEYEKIKGVTHSSS